LETRPDQLFEFSHADFKDILALLRTDFIITTSVDGYLKFWKKTESGIEFVKQYKSHLGLIAGISVSDDGLLLATIAMDKTMKVYDVINFGMLPLLASWGRFSIMVKIASHG